MKSIPTRSLAWCAALTCVIACTAFGLMLDGYDHRLHPVALPGGQGVPRALAFNLLAFVLPGSLLAWLALRLRGRLDASDGWAPRIGTRVAMLAALAFVAQGLLPLDPQDMDADTSRLHATAWVLWWIASVAGVVLMAFDGRASLRFRIVSATTALLIVLCAPLAGSLLPVAPSQRVALAMWFAWWLVAARQTRARAGGRDQP